MQRLSMFALCLLVVCLHAATTAAQQTPGTPSFVPQITIGPVSINVQNLNALLNIPVMSKSGAFPFGFSFSGNFYMIEGGNQWQPSITTTLGQLTPGASGIGTIATYTVQTNTTCPSGSPATIKYADWVVIDAQGTHHPLPLADFADSQGCLTGSGFTAQTQDNTGYTAVVAASGSWNLYTSGGFQLGSTVGYDSNSNSISFNSATGAYTDTLGLTTLTYSPTASTQTATWTDTLGNSPDVKITDTTGLTVRTNFGCTGISDYYISGDTQPLPTSISFPDGNSMALAYEGTNGYAGDYTGRLSEVTLRGGGTVQFNWNPNSAANDGMDCATFIPKALNITTSDGTVSLTSNGGTVTTKLDIGQNKTYYNFSSSGLLTEVRYFPNTGTITTPTYASTPANQTTYCYNSGASPTVSSCITATVTEPITQLAVFTSPNGLSPSETYKTFDNYGNVTYSAQYDFGGTSPLVATTNTMAKNGSGSCSGISATINNKVCSSTTVISGNTVGASQYVYSASGNLLTTSFSPNGGSTYLSNSTANSYNANGTPSVLYDLANNPTTFTYSSSYYTDCGSCTQYPFATSRTQGGLATYSYYNGYGAVKTEDTDANGNHTFYCYNNTTGTTCNGTVADPWSRVRAVVDPLNNEVFKTYSATSLTSDFSFNSGSSVNDVTTTLDGYGRTTNMQKQQGPSSSNYDTVSTYRGFGSVIPTVQTTNPCSTSSGSQCGTTYGPTASGSVSPAGILTSILTQSGSNAVTKTTYDENDVTSILGPSPSGENTKATENEYNGLGWLTSSCAISSLVTGESACAQNTGGNNGVLTTITYSSTAGSQIVKSFRNISGHSKQSRSITTDGLGRVISKTTPEGGTWAYTYDTACSSAYTNVTGRSAKTVDPNGDTLCYSYDTLGRILLVEATNGTTSSCRWFYYDNGKGQGTASGGYTGTVPTGITLSNQYGRMVEAATDACTGVASHTSSTLITDEWTAYDKDGHPTTEWELTPNSTQYYESTATYTGPMITALDLASPSLFTATYKLDGEGRWNALTTGANTIVQSSGVIYNAAGQPTNISLGTGTDYDGYAYDPNTLLMTGWTFQVNSVDETGALTWNPNNTLQELVITDGFNANGSITCSYNSGLVSGTGYDDLGRLIGHSCTGTGGTWNQAFSYDQFNNITKSGTGFTPWNPGYSTTTNHYACTGCTYDSNGDVTNDGTNSYSWNVFGKMASVNMSGTGCSTNGDCIVYDALGRAVEIDDGSTKTEIWYTPLGKTAYMNGTTFGHSYFPAPGGGTAFSESYYMHKDWMGNARIVSYVPGTPSVYTDRAFAPYGEIFNIFGSTGQNDGMFTGLTQDIFYGMYETPNREMTAVQSRFISPDPAGAGWNQYAWPTNPNSEADPSGLLITLPSAGSGFSLIPLFQGGSDWPYQGISCTVDGIDESCGMVGDSAVQCPDNACTSINASGQLVQFWAFANGGSGYYAFSGPGALYYSAGQAIDGAIAYYQPLSETSDANGMRQEYQWKTYEDDDDIYSFVGQASQWLCGSTDTCTSDPNTVVAPDGTTFEDLGHTHPWPDRGAWQFNTDIANGYTTGEDYVSIPGGGVFLIQLQVGTLSSTICQVSSGSQVFPTISSCQ